MNDLTQMKQQARALREQEKYSEAVQIYQVLWSEQRASCNEWDGWGYAQSLRKLNRSAEALDVCREVHRLKPDFVLNRNLYAWCIWDLYIARVDDEQIAANSSEFFRAASAILDLGEPGDYSPFARTLLRVVKYLKERPGYPAQQILEWTGKVSPDQLSPKVGIGSDGKGGQMEYASEREQWYSARCKALREAERYQECIDLATEALEAVQRFHHDDDVWLKYHRARAMSGLGDNAAAVDELRALLPRKKDWFVYRDIAQCLYNLGQFDEALASSLDAALAPLPEIENKWRLFLLMGWIIRDQGKLEDAKRHVLLAARVRQKRSDWTGTPKELAQTIAELGVDLNSGISTDDLQQELQRIWRSAKFAGRPRVQGMIKNLLQDRDAGFIQGQGGEDYYFKFKSFKGPHHMLQPGLAVVFYVEKNPDPSKRDIAVEIRPVNRK